MIGALRTVVLDARDFAGLARFYQELAGWEQVYADPAGKPFCFVWDLGQG